MIGILLKVLREGFNKQSKQNDMISIILAIAGICMHVAAGVAAFMYNDYYTGFSCANISLLLMGVSRLTAK